MARPLRIEFAGAIYHVTGRWRKERARRFDEDQGRTRFLDPWASRIDRHDVRLILFRPMSSRDQLAFKTPRATGSKVRQDLLAAHSAYFKRRHDRHGRVQDGRCEAERVEGASYERALSRCVQLNPVRVKAARRRPVESG